MQRTPSGAGSYDGLSPSTPQLEALAGHINNFQAGLSVVHALVMLPCTGGRLPKSPGCLSNSLGTPSSPCMQHWSSRGCASACSCVMFSSGQAWACVRQQHCLQSMGQKLSRLFAFFAGDLDRKATYRASELSGSLKQPAVTVVTWMLICPLHMCGPPEACAS